MDFTALSTLREALRSLQNLNLPLPPNHAGLRKASQSIEGLSPAHVIRELAQLYKPLRFELISHLASESIHTELRRAILTHPTFLHPREKCPKRCTKRSLCAWAASVTPVLKPLLEAERNSEEPCQNSLRLGEVLLERANSVRLARRRVVSHSRHVTVANLVVAAPARIQRLSQLQEAFTQAISLNSDLPWQERRDAVRDVWQQMRSEYHALDVFVRHVGENELPRDARDVFAEMKDAMELVRQRETQLDESNIGYRKLDGRRVRGKNDEAMDDDEEEEEWEDIVDFEDEGMIEESDDDVRRVDEMLAREEASRTTTVTPSMNTPRPEVKDWVAVMKGAEGQNLNDSLLKKLEQSHAKRVGTASEHAEILTFGIDRTDAKSNGNRRGKGKGRGRGNSRGIEMSGTARDRLRKKLGIKKTKKKSLLDD